MKPALVDVVREGDLGGVKTQMSFDENSLAHLMSVLTDLYSDPETAVIREYSTNAWDSHVQAGIARPIEVSLPGAMSPYFKVKDYGVGLSVDEITSLYSKYGASTKRDSNEFNGTLGLGGKSALTYTQQFTIISVKNGVKTTVSVSRNENNIGEMEIVDTSATVEPNGVEIIIPSRNYDSMRRRAEHFFRFWKPGTVLIDGAEPAKIDGHWVSDNILIDTESSNENDYVVMGGVAYPLDNSDYQIYDHGYRYGYRQSSFTVVAFVEIGDVAFAPSRESLQYTPATKAKIAEIRKNLAAMLPKFVTDQISGAKTHADAISAKRTWQRLLGEHSVKNVKWNNLVIEESYPLRTDEKAFVYKPEAARYAVQRERGRIYYDTIVRSITVTGYEYSDVPSHRRAKMRKWASDNGHVNKWFFVTNESSVLGSPWTDGAISVTWDEVSKVKVNPSTAGGSRYVRVRNEKYDIVNKNGFISEASDFDHDDIVFYGPQEKNAWGEKFDSRAIRDAFPDRHIAVVGKNRWDKFKRDWPTAQHISIVLEQAVKDAADAVTEHDSTYHAIENDYNKGYDILTHLPDDGILDPEVVRLIKVAKAGRSDAYENFRSVAAVAQTMNVKIPTVIKPVKLMNIRSKYPLATRSNVKHSVVYMNAIYSGSN